MIESSITGQVGGCLSNPHRTSVSPLLPWHDGQPSLIGADFREGDDDEALFSETRKGFFSEKGGGQFSE